MRSLAVTANDDDDDGARVVIVRQMAKVPTVTRPNLVGRLIYKKCLLQEKNSSHIIFDVTGWTWQSGKRRVTREGQLD